MNVDTAHRKEALGEELFMIYETIPDLPAPSPNQQTPDAYEMVKPKSQTS